MKECVSSILAQTLGDFQLQVLDNCSTDGTVAYIQSLNDERITIYPAERPLTIEENWARITTIPKSEFITLIGHDDVLDGIARRRIAGLRILARQPTHRILLGSCLHTT